MADRRLRPWLTNVLLIMVSGVLSLGAVELALRVVFHPVDYLLPTIVSDSFLGHRVEGGSGGHDEWGFRNYSRPNTASVVAIGDSTTYGIAARANESWPAVLSELTGRPVYNMSLGGYGPLHYLYLMRERALAMRPDDIVVGLYFSNDFLDAINLAYGNENWTRFRIVALNETEKQHGFVIDQPESAADGKVFGALRSRLAHSSVLYRLATSLALFDRFRGVNTGSQDPRLYVFSRGDSRTILAPTQNRTLMNVDDPQIVVAVEITKRALSEMRTIAEKNGIRLHILLIPTKELAYADLLEEQDLTREHPDMSAAIQNEQIIRGQLIDFLQVASFSYVDPLPELRRGVLDNDMYPSNDGHPNAAGYALIAQQVANAIGR